jgi:hypothetical protein
VKPSKRAGDVEDRRRAVATCVSHALLAGALVQAREPASAIETKLRIAECMVFIVLSRQVSSKPRRFSQVALPPAFHSVDRIPCKNPWPIDEKL